MKILSLFDGMSCGQIALQELGVKVDKYYASEIDKFAIEQTQSVFPNTIQLGSVVNIDVSKLDNINILMGGSPCQSFSFAGKGKGMSTECEIEILTLGHYLQLKSEGFEFQGQSYLFWEYVRILTDIRKYNPNVLFLLENVEMSKKWERVLSNALGIFGVHINSAKVSAQNRKRIYWTNIKTTTKGLFSDLYTDIPQPKDRGILLKDILQPESEVDEKYYIDSERFLNSAFSKDQQDKLQNNDTFTIETINRFIDGKKSHSENQLNVDKSPCIKTTQTVNVLKLDKQLNKKADQNKASCFTAGGNSGGNHSDMDIICVAMRGRNPENPSDRKTGSPTEQRLEPKTDGKTNCLTSVAKDNLLTNGYILRRLTPIECSRLQAVPSWYKWIVSDSQIYKMLGNGWTVEVIKHIFKQL